MSIKLYIFSKNKNQYFYMCQKVKDTRTNEEGVIIKIYFPLNSENTEPIIEVKYENKRVGYTENKHNYLESI